MPLVAGELGPASEALLHHGDVEASPGMLDLAVNVHPGGPPAWLTQALHASISQVHAYPDASVAQRAVAVAHRRHPSEVLVTSGAAEAFSLIAQLQPWRQATVVHPQFTEPHAALLARGLRVDSVVCDQRTDFTLDPDQVPEAADLVVIGNPTNPTGTLHPAGVLDRLRRPGRLLVVDEAFMDFVPGEPESLIAGDLRGVAVVRSLTKLWSIPGVRIGYLLGDPELVGRLRRLQPPWSVSSAASAAALACMSDDAAAEAAARVTESVGWREHLQEALQARGVRTVASRAPFVLARMGSGVHRGLRDAGIAVRRADTFPGLDHQWVRIAARDAPTTQRLLNELDRLLETSTAGRESECPT